MAETSPEEGLRHFALPGGDGASFRPPIVRIDDDLREIDHGEWSGRQKAEVEKTWPELVRSWLSAPTGASMPRGESLSAVRERVLRFLDRVRHDHVDGRILVVTHGTIIRLLLVHFLELDVNSMWKFQLENGALSVVEDHEVPAITAINDSCHLKGVRSRLDVQVR